MKVSPQQRRQAIDAAAEPTKQRYRDQVTVPVDAVLRCISLPVVDPAP